jgi:hypothetical protein
MCQVIIGGHKSHLFCHYRIEGALNYFITY